MAAQPQQRLSLSMSSLSTEEDEPIILPEEPAFSVFEDNSLSLLGRLMNPSAQPIGKLTEAMPRIWRLYDRVRGIDLAKEKVQFIFKREEDLVAVLKERPLSFKNWMLLLERWCADPPVDFLTTMEVWIRMRNIPVNHYTLETMKKVAESAGKVKEIAFDPTVSQTKEYIRALVVVEVFNPLREVKTLTHKGRSMFVNLEYKKVRKRCFHCSRFSHEKINCPLLRPSQPGDGLVNHQYIPML